MKRKIKLLILLLAIAFTIPTSCKKEDGHGDFFGKGHGIPASAYNANVPLAWFKLITVMVRTVPGNTGPVQSRSFGYMGLALYESVVPGMHDYRSIQKQLNGLPELPKPEKDKNLFYPVCANAALANMVRHMFANASATQNVTIDSLENALNTTFKDLLPSQDFYRSAKFGQDISNAIYDWSTTDGGDKGYANVVSPTYVLPVGPGMYVTQTGQVPQHPYWGSNRPFVFGNGTNTQPPPPPAYSTDPTSPFYSDELEVYNESINQVPEHHTIALYWAAIPPPTVSISILSAVLTDKNADLGLAAESYCKLGIAISDAFVSCYRTKYTYNQERPITFIRANFNPTWSPLIPTPPFPDFSSAHSVQTGAAARILADIFGDNTTFTDYSINNRGFTPRTFNKFSDYANEVGLSRIYGGIHNRSADFVGLAQGDKVGKNISALHFKR